MANVISYWALISTDCCVAELSLCNFCQADETVSAIKSVWDNPCGALTFQGEPLQLRNWLHTFNKLFSTCKSSSTWNESEKVVSEMLLIAIMRGLRLMKIGRIMCRV